jgi:serine/threonine-protein kinase RsbT
VTLVHEIVLPINEEFDVIVASRKCQNLTTEMGFSHSDQITIGIVVTELAQNIVVHANHGAIIFKEIQQENKKGILIIARDKGPGIPDIELALQDGFSSVGTLGIGLSGVQRLMDGFKISTEVGKGTTIETMKWMS